MKKVNISEIVHRLLTPTVSMKYIYSNDCSYTGTSMDDKYMYYWSGDHKTGKEVKVRYIDYLKDYYDFQSYSKKNAVSISNIELLRDAFKENKLNDALSIMDKWESNNYWI